MTTPPPSARQVAEIVAGLSKLDREELTERQRAPQWWPSRRFGQLCALGLLRFDKNKRSYLTPLGILVRTQLIAGDQT